MLIGDRVRYRMAGSISTELVMMSSISTNSWSSVVVLGLCDPPLVEGLVQYDHAEPVAGVEEGGGVGVVRRSDRVVSALLHELDLALLAPGIGLSAEEAVVVMDAPAFQLDGLPIEDEPLLRGQRNRADAEHRVDGIDFFSVLPQHGRQPVEMRRVDVPELWVPNDDPVSVLSEGDFFFVRNTL